MKTAGTSLRTDGTPRPLLDEMFMAVAGTVATRSTCPSGARHGALLVRDGHVIATGYGSPPTSIPPCGKCWLRETEKATGKKDWSVCPSVHAELNAILMAAKFGIAVEGSTMYITRDPCDPCLRAMMNAGVFTYKIRNGKDIEEYMTNQKSRLASPWES